MAKTNNRLEITCDTAPLLNTLTQFGAQLAVDLKAVAKITADNIDAEATRRVRRRTGETAEGIVVEESRDGKGYVVVAKNSRMPMLPVWLEFGTKKGKKGSRHANKPFPFMFPAAKLEEGPNQRRMLEAIQNAIDSQGLGD